MILTIQIVLSLLVGYIFGSFSPSYFLGKIYSGIDIRQVNYRYAGTRNVKATLGLAPAAIAAFIDLFKGVAALVFSEDFIGLPSSLTAVPIAAAIVGHIFPFYLRFRGGKGTATAFGTFIWLTAWEVNAGRFNPVTFAAVLALPIITYAASRSGDAAGLVASLFMLVVTPLELRITGLSIFAMTLSVFLFGSFLLTAVRRGVFRLEHEVEVKLWRIIARPFALLFIPIDLLWGRRILLLLLGFLSLAFIFIDVFRLASKRKLAPMFKASEIARFSSMTYFLVATFLGFLVFPREIPYLALIFTTVGDVFGKLFGLRFGKTVLYKKKTLEGSLGFFTGSLMSCYILSLLMPVPLLFVLAGSAFAAAIELFSDLLDDNFSVTLVSGGLLFALRYFLKI